MKHLIILAITIAVSQFTYAQRLQLGVKGGVNVSKIHGENKDADSSIKSAIGYHFGLLGHIHINQKLAIQPEVLYSAEGWRTNYTGTSFDNGLGYVNIPVLVQYMGGSGFRVQTGPQLGFLVNSVDMFNRSNFSWVFGVGYLTKSRFGIDARYNLGLSKMIKEQFLLGSTNVKSRVGQVGIFYQFKHK